MVENIDNIILKDVTLFSVDCVQPEIALESLIFSSKHINFGETILFSNKEPFGIPQNIKFIQIPKINSLIEYSQFILTELNNFIKTDYCLSVHADGFIHNPFLWNNDFKKWDYIGAPWPASSWFVDENDRVGNGGVSFRTKRLLKETSLHKNVNMHEDNFICYVLKKYLITKNIKIAPLEVAKNFSYELSCTDLFLNPETDCFAYHGKNYSDFHEAQHKVLLKHREKRINNMTKIENNFFSKKIEESDIYMHLDTLYEYAKKCKSVAEFGVRHVVSSYAFAYAKPEKLLCLDINLSPQVETFKQECLQENINLEFVQASSLDYEFTEEYDMLFIDTLHTYDQLSQELAKHHSKIKKYIIFHDTVYWGHKNENPVDNSDTGERGEKVGLVPAIREFLTKNKEWKEVCTYTYNNGLTIIERVNPEETLNPYFVYKNVLAGQTKNISELFKLLFEKNNFSLIIEIGSHRGGLSLWLNDYRPNDCDFYTLDIQPNHLQIDPVKEGIKFLKGDCFTDLFDTLKDLIKSNKQVLLLCDGGNKELEFNTFAPILKPNDVIMCHDFADDINSYINLQKEMGWSSGPESRMWYLTNTIQQCNLQPHFFNEAKNHFWGCFIKVG